LRLSDYWIKLDNVPSSRGNFSIYDFKNNKGERIIIFFCLY
jgi:hypothetical protein